MLQGEQRVTTCLMARKSEYDPSYSSLSRGSIVVQAVSGLEQNTKIIPTPTNIGVPTKRTPNYKASADTSHQSSEHSRSAVDYQPYNTYAAYYSSHFHYLLHLSSPTTYPDYLSIPTSIIIRTFAPTRYPDRATGGERCNCGDVQLPIDGLPLHPLRHPLPYLLPFPTSRQ